MAQNIAVIPEMKGTANKEINQAIDELLAEVSPRSKERDRMPSIIRWWRQRIGILQAIRRNQILLRWMNHLVR